MNRKSSTKKLSKQTTTREVRVRFNVFVTENDFDADGKFADPTALVQKLEENYKEALVRKRRAFNFAQWIDDANLTLMGKCLLGETTSNSNYVLQNMMLWLRWEAADVVKRDDLVKLVKLSPIEQKTWMADRIITVLADNERYGSDLDVCDCLSAITFDGFTSGRVFKRDRIFITLDIIKSVPITTGALISRMCADDMLEYSEYITHGAKQLKDKSGKLLSQKEATRIANAAKVAARNAEDLGWYESLQVAKVYNCGFTPEHWTSLQ